LGEDDVDPVLPAAEPHHIGASVDILPLSTVFSFPIVYKLDVVIYIIILVNYNKIIKREGFV